MGDYSKIPISSSTPVSALKFLLDNERDAGTRIRRQSTNHSSASSFTWSLGRVSVTRLGASPRNVCGTAPAALAVLQKFDVEGCAYSPGDCIADYTIMREIGAGAFSHVFEARNYLDSSVALKIVHKRTAQSSNQPKTLPNSISSSYRSIPVATKNNQVARTSTATSNLSANVVVNKHVTKLDHETLIWSRLHHPNILEMTEVIELEDATVIASELASSGTLLNYIINHGAPGLIETHVQRLFNQICNAVEYLHVEAGLIHRDLKLENVLLDSLGNIKICDFGLTIETPILFEQRAEPFYFYPDNNVEPHPKNCQGICCSNPVLENVSPLSISHSISLPPIQTTLSEMTVVGSIHYCSPELLKRIAITESNSNPLYSPTTDIWAIGCILFAMLTGSLPFNDSFIPRLQMRIMSGKFDIGKLKDLPAASEVVAGILEENWTERWKLSEILKHPWVRAGES